jgi:hypothetical protein
VGRGSEVEMQIAAACCAGRLLRIRILRVAALYWFDCVVHKLPSAMLEVIMQSVKSFSCRPAL